MTVGFTERTIENDLLTEQTNSLNEQFNLTIVQFENEWTKGKWTIILKTKNLKFSQNDKTDEWNELLRIKERWTNEWNGELRVNKRWTNELKKIRTRQSLVIKDKLGADMGKITNFYNVELYNEKKPIMEINDSIQWNDLARQLYEFSIILNGVII